MENFNQYLENIRKFIESSEDGSVDWSVLKGVNELKFTEENNFNGEVPQDLIISHAYKNALWGHVFYMERAVKDFYVDAEYDSSSTKNKEDIIKKILIYGYNQGKCDRVIQVKKGYVARDEANTVGHARSIIEFSKKKELLESGKKSSEEVVYLEYAELTS